MNALLPQQMHMCACGLLMHETHPSSGAYFCENCDPCQPIYRTPNIAQTREMADKRVLMMANCEN